ncbi:FRG domain-containing protein [Roseateles sp. P5_E4]
MPEPMFHFMVTASREVWVGGVEEFERSRFLEYSPDDIVKKFENLTKTNIARLRAMPCLCAYEGEEDIRLGTIEDIELQRGIIRVTVDFDPNIPPIPFGDFFPHRKRFGVHEWEFSRTHWAVKSGDLHEKLRASGLLNEVTASRPRLTQLDVEQTAAAIVEAMAARVRSIGSVSEFIAEINQLHNSNKEAFYRGHTDATYQLKPSVFRTNKDGVPLYKDSEHQMFREVLVSNSFDFKDDTSTLDRLVRMQHYELPTRLLDITSNPLIALFFAAFSAQQSTKKLATDGEVIIFQMDRDKIKYFDSDSASCIANLSLLSAKEKDSIDFSMSQRAAEGETIAIGTFNSQEPIKRLHHFISAEKPYFLRHIQPSTLKSVISVKSKLTNDRISSQSGAFLLFGHEAVLEEESTEAITIHRIRVQNKQAILDELERLGIHESSVFPNLVATCNHIKTRYQTKSEPEEKQAE